MIAPHPDDESVATGGLVQTALSLGSRVVVIVLTDGDRNEWPQRARERRWRVGAAARVRWGAERRGEARTALKILGLAPDDMRFLGWPDMGLTQLLAGEAGQLQLRAYGTLLTQLTSDPTRPSVVVLPALTDRHPDHSAAHVLTRLALARAATNCGAVIVSYVVHGAPDPEALAIHPRDEILGRKLAAVKAHTTQHVLSGRRMLRYATRPERFTVEITLRGSAIRAGRTTYTLPWKPPSVLRKHSHLLVASDQGGVWLRPSGVDARRAGQTDDASHLFEWADRRLTLTLTESSSCTEPVYVKLVTGPRLPWIYDYWGWTALGCEVEPDCADARRSAPVDR